MIISSRKVGGNFNPRPPCGERQCSAGQGAVDLLFQSTLPVRGATAADNPGAPGIGISIHAPRAGSDAAQAERDQRARAFQSTLPVRGATWDC